MGLYYKVPLQHAGDINPEILLQKLPSRVKGFPYES